MINTIAALVLLSGALAAALLDNFRVRLQLRSLKYAQAEIVSDALGNSVTVDGVELPKPEDARWKIEERSYTSSLRGKYTDRSMSLGIVAISDECIYVDEGPHMPTTSATKKYCAAVWKEYRSRVARKAIETST